MTEAAAAAAAAAAPATEETPTVVAEDKTTLVLADSKGHILRRTEDAPSGEEATCQHCHKPFGADGYACDKCADVRLCGACAAALAQRVRCGKPERHVLRGFLHDDLCKAHPEYLEGYACDECCEFGPFEAVFHCTECEYDLCPACAGSMMFGVKREGSDSLPGNTLETMLKMMSIDDIQACCRKGPDAAAAPAATASPKKKKDQPRRKPRGGRKPGRR